MIRMNLAAVSWKRMLSYNGRDSHKRQLRSYGKSERPDMCRKLARKEMTY